MNLTIFLLFARIVRAVSVQDRKVKSSSVLVAVFSTRMEDKFMLLLAGGISCETRFDEARRASVSSVSSCKM